MELEKEIIDLKAEVRILKAMVDKLIERTLPTQATSAPPLHPVPLSFLDELQTIKDPESEEVPQKPEKISPFTLKGFANRRATLKEQQEAADEDLLDILPDIA